MFLMECNKSNYRSNDKVKILPLVKILCEEFGADINAQEKSDNYYVEKRGNTALHKAAIALGDNRWCGNLQRRESRIIANIFHSIDKGADVDAVNGRDETPLEIVIGRKYFAPVVIALAQKSKKQ